MEIKTSRVKSPVYGNISLGGRLSRPAAYGMLDISGGVIQFPLRQLRISPGSTVAVQYGGSQTESSLAADMTAQGRVTALSPLGQRTAYTVTMEAQGPINNLNSTFSSSPVGLSQEEIVSLLTGQNEIQAALANGGSVDLGSLVSTAVMPTVFNTVGEAFQSILGLEEFGLEMGYDEPLRLTVGERLFDNFYLDYSRRLGGRPDYEDNLYEFNLSYKFKQGIDLRLTTSEKRDVSAALEGKIRF